MKKIFSLMLIAVAVAGVVSCQKSEIEEQVAAEEPSTEAASYLFATIEGNPKSRVSMTDNGEDGLSFAWEPTDFLTVEISDVTYTYTCSNAEKGIFVCDQVPDFIEGEEYRVVFGESFHPKISQDNSDNSFDGSDETLGLIANFTYTEGEPIHLQFTGYFPIITIICRNFDSQKYKPEVEFDGGDDITPVLSMNCVVDDQGTFYATIVHSPQPSRAREATFKFESIENISDRLTYHVHLQKGFERGVRYMADITDLFHYEADCEPHTVKDLQTNYFHPGQVLLIVDEVIEKEAFKDMEIGDDKSPVDVILPYATTFETGWPKNSSTFYNTTGIKSIYAPKLTSMGTSTFYKSSITSFEAPLLELDDTHRSTFASCSSLTSVKVKSMSVIADNLFVNCEALIDVDLSEVTEVSTGNSSDGGGGGLFGVGLTNISLPKAKSIGDQAISWCPNLESVELPVATSFGSYSFRYCEKLRTLKLTTPELIEYDTNAFKSITGDAKVEPQCHLYLSAVNYANVTNGNEWGGVKWKEITLVEAE